MQHLKLFPIALLLLAGGCATTENPIYTGHSKHGEAFNKGPRQAAYLMGTTSNVSFPITTNSTEAQAFFNQEELKAAMGEAGVTAPPTFVFANEA